MILKPDGRIDLNHRVFHLRGVPGSFVVVASLDDGHFSIIGSELQDVRTYHHPSKIHAISPDPVNQRLAMVCGDSRKLLLHSLAGTELLEIVPTPDKHGIEDCHFDSTGRFLFLSVPHSDDECEIQLVETETWSLVESLTINDPFGGSSSTFFATGQPDLISLWLAAGQDGQQVYWLKRCNGGFFCMQEPNLQNTIPPVFSPSGEFFLVANDKRAICKYAFHNMRQVGAPLESWDEDNPFAESLVFLNESQALAGTNEGRAFVINTESLEIEEEAFLEGHEPGPVGEYYPTLARERGLGTDISWFMRLGNVTFFMIRRDSGTELAGWEDTLLWLRVKS